MDRLPFEICAHIAALALLDGGRAGCALAAASRVFRYAFAPWRYSSVALRGPRQIRAFTALVARSRHPAFEKRRRAPTLPVPDVRVTHLFLADCRMDPDDPLAAIAWADWQLDSSASTVRTKLKSTLPRPLVRDSRSFSAWDTTSVIAQGEIHALLGLLADSLTHLHMHIWLGSPWVLVPNVVFPALLELTCSYRCRYHEYVDPSVPELDHACILPALRRLTLIADNSHSASHLWPMVELPPSLTHLRISETLDPRLILHELSFRAATSPGWIPAGLHTIIIAPHAPSSTPAPWLKCTEERYESYPLCRFIKPYAWHPGVDPELFPWDYPAWRAVASHKIDMTKRIFMVREHATWDEQRLFEDWLDRHQGGTACWVGGTSLRSERRKYDELAP
jgi:hypothetical protein